MISRPGRRSTVAVHALTYVNFPLSDYKYPLSVNQSAMLIHYMKE